jgi:predicted aspartyl protease
MRTIGANGVGRITVEIEVANNEDLVRAKDGTLRPEKVRRTTVEGVVDTGAAMLVLPQAVVKQLGLPLGKTIKVRFADGRQASRREAKGAFVRLLGRDDTFTAIIEPKRQTALIGAIVLEALDLIVDCQRQRVIPRDPRSAIYEIE